MLEEAVSQSSSSSSSPTLWAIINSWLTPTVFFVLLQFVIATIYITSNTANTNHKHQQQEQNSQGDDTQQQQQQLPGSPLQRLKSINFNSYTHRSQEPHLEVHNAPPQEDDEEELQPQIPRSPTILQRLNSINLHNHFPTTPDIHESEKTHHLDNDETHEAEEHQHLDDTAIVESDEAEEEDKGEEAGPSLDDVYSKILQGQGRHFNRSHSDSTAASGKSASTKSALSHFTEDAVENRRLASLREGKVSAAVDSGGDDGGVDAKADDFINKFKQQLKMQRLDSVAR